MGEITKKYFNQTKKHWFEDSFFKQRISLVSKNLSPKNRAVFNKMPYNKQKIIIAGLIHKGKII